MRARIMLACSSKRNICLNVSVKAKKDGSEANVTDKRLLVYVDLEGEPRLVGRLWARSRKGRESATFEYDEAWLRHPVRFPLEPALGLSHGPQHTAAGRRLFGALGDSAPDRWGRLLIQRDGQSQVPQCQITKARLVYASGDGLRFLGEDGQARCES